MFTLFVSLLTRALCLRGRCLHAHDVYNTDIYFIRCCGAAAGIFNAWNRAQNTIYNLAQSPHRQQQHDREQQQKDQEWRRFLLSDNNDYDREDIIISIDDVSAMSSSSPSAPVGDDDDINNKNNNHNHQGNSMMNKQKRNKVVSFRLSEPEYARYLSMAKICHENGLTNKPDIVSFIRLSMECLWQYINNSHARGQFSAEKEENQQQPQKKQEGGIEPQDLNHHAMTTTTSSTAAAAESTTNTAMGKDISESVARTPSQPPPTSHLFNLHEYFQPVFDEVDKLNKMLDSHIEEENDRGKEKKK